MSEAWTPKRLLDLCSGNIENASAVERAIKDGLDCIKEYGDKERIVAFPSVARWATRETSTAFNDNFPRVLVFFVDGTFVESEDTADTLVHKAMFNTKHGGNGWVFTILVTSMGRIVWVSDVEGGRIHDATAWKDSKVCELLAKKYPNANVRFKKEVWQCALGGDKAYRCMERPEGWTVYITKSGEADGDGDDEAGVDMSLKGKSLFTPEIAPHRAVVERVFGRIKTKFEVFTRKRAWYTDETAKKIVDAAAVLYNMELDEGKCPVVACPSMAKAAK